MEICLASAISIFLLFPTISSSETLEISDTFFTISSIDNSDKRLLPTRSLTTSFTRSKSISLFINDDLAKILIIAPSSSLTLFLICLAINSIIS